MDCTSISGGHQMKIPIPKEALTQIMNDYNCSEEQAAKAYLDAQDKANETVKSFLDEKFGPARTTDVKDKPRTYTPREIKGHLDKYVIGQEEYKKRLSKLPKTWFRIRNISISCFPGGMKAKKKQCS
jgi:hypothetical protein